MRKKKKKNTVQLRHKEEEVKRRTVGFSQGI